jgi:hypothetical protein
LYILAMGDAFSDGYNGGNPTGMVESTGVLIDG